MTATTDTAAVARLYRATTTPQLVSVPPLTFLCIDGHGDPNTSPAYADAVRALYAVSYAARSALTKAGGPPYRVSPLEGLWSAQDMTTFLTGEKSRWDWTMMIRQPDAVTGDLVARLAEEVAARKPVPAARELRLVVIEEGTAAQILHIGPYAAEGPAIARLHDVLRERGVALDGDPGLHRHHEIYLSDPRRTAPERLRTILRQPYSAAPGPGGVRGA